MDTNWQAAQPLSRAAFAIHKESTLKLSLETRYQGDVIIVHCQGRIVYRDEAAALSRVVGEVMPHARKLVLDLSGVSSIDSAGIGELALLHTRAQKEKADFKVAGPSLCRLLSSSRAEFSFDIWTRDSREEAAICFLIFLSPRESV
jgi:anti-anti-sigma factor